MSDIEHLELNGNSKTVAATLAAELELEQAVFVLALYNDGDARVIGVEGFSIPDAVAAIRATADQLEQDFRDEAQA